MSSSLAFDHAIPGKFKLPEPRSTSKAILRKSLQEILPQSQQVHTFANNNIISFMISSNSDVVSFPESYFKASLRRVKGSGESAENFELDGIVSLDEGGVHSLIRHIEVRSAASGILLQRIEHYNRWYALQSNLHQSPDEIEYMGNVYGDSMSGMAVASGYADNGRQLITISECKAADGVTTLAAGSILGFNIQVGDMLYIQAEAGTDSETLFARITAVDVANSQVTLDCWPKANTTGPAHAFLYKQEYLIPARVNAIKQTKDKYPVTFKPLMSLFEHSLPLFLMKGGVEIRIELEDPNIALRKNAITGNTMGLDYQLEDLRFMGMMVTPHPDIVDEYAAQWRSDKGLMFNLPSVKTIRANSSTGVGSDNIQIHPGVRSARKIYVVHNDASLLEGSSEVNKRHSSLSTWVQSGIESYQGKVGSHNYPHRELKCDNYGNYEALQQLRMVSNSDNFRFAPRDWLRDAQKIYVTDIAAVPDCSKFIMGMDLSRDDGALGALTGVDLSVVPFELEVKRTTASPQELGYTTNGTMLYFFFVEHDAFLQLSSQQTVVRN